MNSFFLCFHKICFFSMSFVLIVFLSFCRYSGDTYASYRSKSATRLVGIYKRSNSEQLLNEGFSNQNFPNDDATKPDVWKSEDDLSRLTYKGIAPTPRKSLPDNGSLSRHLPADLSASWSPHYGQWLFLFSVLVFFIFLFYLFVKGLAVTP